MLALCLMLSSPYYAENYAGIIDTGLQHVLTAFKYPSLSEIINEPNKGINIPPPPGLEPQATRFPVKCA